jgi:hypothetical protein
MAEASREAGRAALRTFSHSFKSSKIEVCSKNGYKGAGLMVDGGTQCEGILNGELGK